jgi:hypothetical protein
MLSHITTVRESGSPVYSRMFGGYQETDGGAFTGFNAVEVEAEPFTGFEAAAEDGEVFTGFEPAETAAEPFTGFEAALMEGENFTGFWNRNEQVREENPEKTRMH